MKNSRVGAWFTLCALSAAACHHGPKLTAWTTGEAGAPAEVAAVYRAVLDEIFGGGSAEPTLIVVDQTTVPTLVEIDTESRRPHRRPDAIIAPFRYRIPIAFADSVTLRALSEEGRRADSIAYTVPMTDIRYHQRAAGPFMARYPGAWGRLTLGRVGFGRGLSYGLVEVRFAGTPPQGEYGHEIFRLAPTDGKWKVLERIPREGAIKAGPIPYRMLHGWIDSLSLPVARRRMVRGTVKDSASGAPIPSAVIRIKSAPLGKQGEMLWDKVPEEWGVVFTNPAGEFAVSGPPSGYVSLELECPPRREVRGAGLGIAVLQPESGLDTILEFRVRSAACAELAPAMATEAEQHRKDVERAKTEAADRAVQGNIWGTLRDSRTGHPVPRARIRVDERGGIGGTDSLGRFWLWGFAPGTRKIIVHCPLKRQWLGKIATTLTVQAGAAMKDTMDISIDMDRCADVPVDTVRIRSRGVLSSGFEDGFFTPCKPFNQIELGGYRDFSRQAYLSFAKSVIEPRGGWPKVTPERGYTRFFLDVEGDLIGPGSYGHMGIATYELVVTRVVSARAASKSSCSDTQLPSESSTR